MPSQISTALSDGILALFTLIAAARVYSTSTMAAVGFLPLVAAAACGTVRFSQSEPTSDIIACHKYLAWLVPVIGMPAIAAAYCVQANVIFISRALIAGGVAVLFLQKYLSRDLVLILGDVIGGCSMVHILVLSLRDLNMYGLVGAVLYVIAGLVIKTEGKFQGFLRVDLFHYALVLANVALSLGLLRTDKPLYYQNE